LIAEVSRVVRSRYGRANGASGVLFGSVVATVSVVLPNSSGVFTSRNVAINGIAATVDMDKESLGRTTSSLQGTVLCCILIGTRRSMMQNAKFGSIAFQLLLLLP
jgi:hypothetical protein